MILPTLPVVAGVLLQTKQKFFLGSTNKIAGTDPAKSKRLDALRKKRFNVSTHADRAALAAAYYPPNLRGSIDTLRQTGQLGANPAQLVSLFDTAISGNCYDQALYAVGVFATRGLVAVERISLEGGDHTLCAVGRLDSVNGQATDLQDFATWGDAAYICDPWTNIACLARDYPRRWNEKMEKWQKKSLRIGYYEGDKYSTIEAKEEKDSPTVHKKASADRLVAAGTYLTLYVYANGLVLELVKAGALTYVKTPALGNPIAYSGAVRQVHGALYSCPYVSPDKVCKRYQWFFQNLATPLPKLNRGAPYATCAAFLKETVFPKVELPVPTGLDSAIQTKAFEEYIDRALDWTKSDIVKRFLKAAAK